MVLGVLVDSKDDLASQKGCLVLVPSKSRSSEISIMRLNSLTTRSMYLGLGDYH
jgi:hypothetical protein